MQKYLAASTYIDWHAQSIQNTAAQLAGNIRANTQGHEKFCAEEAIVKVCFEFVRDEIKHSGDYKLNPVTCKASDVLKHKTGYCYAKSHLLAALLRANNIPAGLCYQRLTIENDTPPFCLHGLNAVYLKNHGWYRLDPRGNKQGVNASFTPPIENLAFPIKIAGEADLPEIWAEPLSIVVDALEQWKTVDQMAKNLPDIELIS